MRRSRIIWPWPAPALLVLILVPTAASAQKWEWGLSLGYSHLSLDDTAGSLDEQGGFRFEPRFTWRPFDQRPELRLGIGIGFSYYYDESDAGEIVSPPFSFDVDSYEDVSLCTPEFQVSWRQPVSDRWWIEGGIGIGPAFGFYTAGDVVFDELFDEDIDEDDVGLGVRPFIRTGFRGGDTWNWGLEASYQWTDIDFGQPVGGDVEEWYVGVFFSFGR